MIFSKENISRIGVVVRDENGMVLGSCTKRLPQAYSAMEVEAIAAATALVLSNDIGVRRVILKVDSLAVIRVLREGEQPLSPTGLLLENVRMKSMNFINVRKTNQLVQETEYVVEHSLSTLRNLVCYSHI